MLWWPSRVILTHTEKAAAEMKIPKREGKTHHGNAMSVTRNVAFVPPGLVKGTLGNSSPRVGYKDVRVRVRF